MDYSIFYKTSYENGKVDCGKGYDFFFSAFDNCERTSIIFENILAEQKIWINFPHYNTNYSNSDVYQCVSYKED